MKRNQILNSVKEFLTNQSGETAVQITMVFSFAVVIGVMFGVPLLNNASKDFAYQKQFGVDPVQTSSVGEAKKSVKRYTIRKSIFDSKE